MYLCKSKGVNKSEVGINIVQQGKQAIHCIYMQMGGNFTRSLQILIDLIGSIKLP